MRARRRMLLQGDGVDFFFFFQAEDGIRDWTVTGVQTCALPICQIATAHTFFNIGISLVFLPFTPLAARAIEALVPDDQQGDSPFRTRYVDEQIGRASCRERV